MDNKKIVTQVSINMSKRKTFRLDELKAKRAVLTVSRCSSCSCRKGGGRAGRVQEQASVVSGGVQQLWARATHQWFPIWWWVYRSETYNRKSRYIKLHDKCCSCVASSPPLSGSLRSAGGEGSSPGSHGETWAGSLHLRSHSQRHAYGWRVSIALSLHWPLALFCITMSTWNQNGPCLIHIPVLIHQCTLFKKKNACLL